MLLAIQPIQRRGADIADVQAPCRAWRKTNNRGHQGLAKRDQKRRTLARFSLNTSPGPEILSALALQGRDAQRQGLDIGAIGACEHEFLAGFQRHKHLVET